MKLVLTIVVAGILSLVGLAAWAEGETNPAALAKALPQATVTLDQALKASEREGQPISAKYEIEDGALQLSVYTMKGAGFSEVIVDHKAGGIAKSEKITEGDDLKAAQTQSAAMARPSSRSMPPSAAPSRPMPAIAPWRSCRRSMADGRCHDHPDEGSGGEEGDREAGLRLRARRGEMPCNQ